MLEQMEHTWTWLDVKLNQRLGQRGAEMTEYAIVLAVVAVLGAWFYGAANPSNNDNDSSKYKTFTKVLGRFWTFISEKLSSL